MNLVSRAGIVALLALLAAGAQAQTPEQHGHYGGPGGPPHGNVPVGLLADATFESSTCQMKSGDRFILVTDGVTEAENAMGDFFEDFRLEAAASKSPTLEGIFSAVTEFCAGNPLNDDCTVVELVYSSAEAQA